MSLLILSALYFLSLKEVGEKTAVIKDVGKRDQNVKVLLHSKVYFASFRFFVTASLRCLTSESLVEVAVMFSQHFP